MLGLGLTGFALPDLGDESVISSRNVQRVAPSSLTLFQPQVRLEKGMKALFTNLTVHESQGGLLVVQFAVFDSELSFEAARIGPDALGALDQTSVPQQGNFWLGVLHCCYLLSSQIDPCASNSGQNFPRHPPGICR